jgi:hypothetical protein
MNTRPINFRTLDLNLLKVFDVVMAERNVTRAAARLAMTQPRSAMRCAACANRPTRTCSCRHRPA